MMLLTESGLRYNPSISDEFVSSSVNAESEDLVRSSKPSIDILPCNNPCNRLSRVTGSSRVPASQRKSGQPAHCQI